MTDNPLVGFGMYQHHEPLCAPDSDCGWCRRERARNAPARVRLQQTLDSRVRTKQIIVQRAIDKRRRHK